ncbi:MAG: hypothetical protein HXY40_04045 [Chloroflexi bacterium]|nr:hypothetical protein [Chloroflexota bacterium]
MNQKTLSRTMLIGLMLAVLGIGLFLLLWAVFGQMGMANLPRLILALCLPPAVIALLVGGYMLLKRPTA